jgi:transcription elongation GreA/GreB family factor
MNLIEMKREILRCGIARQQEIIDDFKRGIREMEEGIATDGEIDNARLAANNEIKERIYAMGKQLQMVEDEMVILQRINPDDTPHTEVHVGSVAETEQRTFFVSVSIEDFEALGKKFYGISTKAPLYAEMMGKKKGDSFGFNGISYRILDLY